VRRYSAAGLAAAVLSSCLTYDPYTQEKEVSKATKGAVIGAVAGAAGGLLTGDDSRERRKRALIGAGVGALAGGAVGAYMDRQEAALRARLANSGVGVTRMGDDIQLVMANSVTFETNRAEIRSDFYETLNSVAIVLVEYNQTLIEISGHADSTGEATANQTLSEKRAQSVLRYLFAQQIPEQRMIAQGFGETKPVASNENSQGRALNRRVEIRLVPLTL
jgi:outer membrane protein OmpA-like peptidoglycan-associated protein